MASEIIRENEGAITLKTLGKPKRSTVVDSSTRTTDIDADIASLAGDGSGKERPVSSREQAVANATHGGGKKTILGNAGPNRDGSVDWSRNPDCVDYILQKHESSTNKDTPEGYLATAQKCSNQFNKLFKMSVTDQSIADALAVHNTPGAKAAPREAVQGTAAAPVANRAPTEPEENFYPLGVEKLIVDARQDAVQLSGTKFEICKILNCSNICVAPLTRGGASQSGTFKAVCKASTGGVIDAATCPQEAALTPKEQFAYEMYLSQFNGDQLKAKKFLYMSRALYADEKKKRK